MINTAQYRQQVNPVFIQFSKTKLCFTFSLYYIDSKPTISVPSLENLAVTLTFDLLTTKRTALN